MTNADKFKSLFGIYATELWAMPEKDFLKWLNSEVGNCSEFPNNWIPYNERSLEMHTAVSTLYRGEQMNDLIYRQKAIEALKENRALYCDNTPESFRCLTYGEKCRVDEIDSCIAELVSLPSAEPEIIRCKDCKYYCNVLYSGTQFECGKCCRTFIEDVKPDDFCSRTERRING